MIKSNKRLRDEEIYRRYSSGERQCNLAKEYNLSISYVSRICGKYGYIDDLRSSETGEGELYKLLESLDISDRAITRAYNCLIQYGINSVRKLSTYTYDELLEIEELGYTSVNELLRTGIIHKHMRG